MTVFIHRMLFIQENTICFRVILSTGTKTSDVNDRESMAETICYAVNKMIEKIVTEKSARSRGRAWCRLHNQSQKRLTFDTIVYNLITGKQYLPARPRDFRVNLSEEERMIQSGELSDVLSKLVAFFIIDNHRSNFPFRRGRPNDELRSERRGRNSFYTHSDLTKEIHAVLKDPSNLKFIDDGIDAKKMHGFLKYSIASVFYQAKEDEQAFLNSLKPYGLKVQQLELNAEKEGPWILIKEISDSKLLELADAYAKKEMEHLLESDIPLIYEIAIILQKIKTDN